MGFGLPAAIGAKVACPDMPVIAFAGDGGVQMTFQELAVAREQRANVILAIINNQYLGMVRQWQDMFFDRRYSGVDLSVSPDFVKLAEAYDCLGLRATNEDEVDAVIERALEERERPVVIDFRVSREENVFPMIPAGGSVNEMRLE
jgi:acetolactate synthase-1/2/3 large subunit